MNSNIKPNILNINGIATKIFPLSKDFQLIERIHELNDNLFTFDVFPHSWFLFFSEFPLLNVEILTPEGYKRCDSIRTLFLPPFSLVRWKLYKGINKWKAFRGECLIPSEFQTVPLGFKEKVGEFNEQVDVLEFVKLNYKNAIRYPNELNRSKISPKLKLLIDQQFSSEISLEKIFLENNFDVSGSSHLFKSTYSISPNEYRIRLQINLAIRKAFKEKSSITQTCYESGFDSYSSFFRNLKAWLPVSPSKIWKLWEPK